MTYTEERTFSPPSPTGSPGASEPREGGTPETEGSRFARAHHILLYFVGAVVIIWLLTGFYQVKSGEVAIVERLGTYLGTGGKAIPVGQGLNWHLPWPIDRVHKMSTQQLATLRVSAFETTPPEYAQFRQEVQRTRRYRLEYITAIFNPYLITADRNVVHMDVSVIYRVNDPVAWLNTISHSTADIGTPGDYRQRLFQEIAQRALVAQVAKLTLEEVLFTDQQKMAGLMQQALGNALEVQNHGNPGATTPLGVEVVRVDVVRVRAPEPVQPAFDRVQQARANLETERKRAEGQAAAAIQQAESERVTMKTDAEREANTRLTEAQGEVSRFTEVYQQYLNSPETTRFDIFAETLRTIMDGARRSYVIVPGQKTTIILDPPQYDANQVRPQ